MLTSPCPDRYTGPFHIAAWSSHFDEGHDNHCWNTGAAARSQYAIFVVYLGHTDQLKVLSDVQNESPKAAGLSRRACTVATAVNFIDTIPWSRHFQTGIDARLQAFALMPQQYRQHGRSLIITTRQVELQPRNRQVSRTLPNT